MAITMRMVARGFFFPRHRCHTRAIVKSPLYAHKRTPKSRCAICNGCEDTANMSPRSRGTCLADLAGDQKRCASAGKLASISIARSKSKLQRTWPQGQHPWMYPKMAGCRVLGAGCRGTRKHPRSNMLLQHAGAHVMLRAGILACLCCWGALKQHRQTNILGRPSSLAGHRPACQHASMSTTRVLA